MTERSKTILKLLLKEQIYISRVIRDKLKNSIKQLKAKLKSGTPLEFHLVEKIHQTLYKKSFNLTKKRHIRKSDELINKKTGTKSAISITIEMGY